VPDKTPRGSRKPTRAPIDEALLRTVFDRAATGVGVADSEGRFLAMNPALERILGYPAEEWEELRLSDTVHPDDREKVEKANRDLFSGESDETVFEHRFLHKHGEVVWARVAVSLERDKKGAPSRLIAIVEDVSESKRAEEALANSEEKLLAVFRSVPVAILVAGIDDGRIYDVNEEYERMFECSYDDVVGKTSIELGLWADPEGRQRLIDLVEKNGKVEELEVACKTLSGRALTARANALPITVSGERYLIFALVDITQRKQIDEQLEMVKQSIDVHPDGAYWIDSDFCFFYVNDAACRAVGYEREELIGQPLSLIDPNATPEEMKTVWAQLPHDRTYLGELLHRRKDGSEFPVEITATYVQLGGKDYYCSFARDISERKRSEEERAMLEKGLQQAQKMEAIGRLAGGVAHNFNNILTALGGYCELLLAKLPEGSDCRPEAEQIKRAADHAAAVTRELLVFSRRETGRQVKLDLNAVVVQTQLLLRELIRSDIKIVAALAPVVPLVLADRSQLEQVLANLVVNATDAMPEGGVIGIETGDLEIATARPVAGGATLDPGHYVTLAVKDSGFGMDEETLSHVFEPFFTTKDPSKGTGLGLATVYGIVEESGGRIVVESELKQGTSVTIYFPALPART